MEVCAAPSFTSLRDALFATCRIVVSYDWSSAVVEAIDYYPYGGQALYRDGSLRVSRHAIRVARAVGHFAPGIVTRMGGNRIAGSGERSELEPVPEGQVPKDKETPER
jgi:hypothetical protein